MKKYILLLSFILNLLFPSHTADRFFGSERDSYESSTEKEKIYYPTPPGKKIEDSENVNNSFTVSILGKEIEADTSTSKKHKKKSKKKKKI